MLQKQYLKNKKVLITGGAGFIGSNLARECIKANANVSIFIRRTSNKWRIGDILGDLEIYTVDLLDCKGIRKVILKIKPEIIFHTATYGGYPFQDNAEKISLTNIMGTINLVNECSRHGFDIFINTGSSSEYGIKSEPMAETDLLEPVTLYGVTKSTATLFCQMKAKKENMPITTLRLFSPYGYYEESTRLFPSIILSCLKNKYPKVLSPNSVRDFIFIEDVIDAYFKTVKKGKHIKGGIFNIGYGKQYSVSTVVDRIIDLTESKAKSICSERPNPRIEPKIWQADISKAEKILNWVPKYDLTNGLEKTINWFKENISLYTNI